MEHISLEVADGVAVVTLNRPDKLNAFTDAMEAELLHAFDICDADDEVRVVILTGQGRAFCAGMDLQDGEAAFEVWRSSATTPAGSHAGVDSAGRVVRRDGGGRVALRMFDSRKPTIAAINGLAVGVGITMTLAADIRMAADSAKIGFVFNRLGLTPEACSSWFLPRLVPMQTALEWVLSGRMITAQEAHAHSLVRSLHPVDELQTAAKALATEIAVNTAPVSAALARQMLWRMLGAEHPVQAHRVETHALNLRGVGPDAKEGISALVQKRPPRFPERVSKDLPNLFPHWPAPEFVSPDV